MARAGSPNSDAHNSRMLIRSLRNKPSSRTPNEARSQQSCKLVLRQPFFEFDINTEGAVLIPQGHHGHGPCHVVLHLNDLLLR